MKRDVFRFIIFFKKELSRGSLLFIHEMKNCEVCRHCYCINQYRSQQAVDAKSHKQIEERYV